MIAPDATNRSEPSNDIVNSLSLWPPIEIHSVPHVARMRGYLSQGAQAGAASSRTGAHDGIQSSLVVASHLACASRIQVMIEPSSAASMPSGAPFREVAAP